MEFKGQLLIYFTLGRKTAKVTLYHGPEIFSPLKQMRTVSSYIEVSWLLFPPPPKIIKVYCMMAHLSKAAHLHDLLSDMSEK